MLEERQLGEVLAALALRALEGPFHRSVLHRHIAQAIERRAALHILSGEWSRRTGGRFNYPTLETSQNELGEDWRLLNFLGVQAPSQRLGHAAYMSGRVEAIAYRSTVWPAGLCLAVFPERLAPRSYLEIIDPDGILSERIP